MDSSDENKGPELGKKYKGYVKYQLGPYKTICEVHEFEL